jgi:hypothetical protein
MAVEQDLEIQRGDNERLLAVITPFTAAAELHFTAKKKLNDTDDNAIISKALGAGIAVTVAGDANTPAQAQIEINKADTQALPNKLSPPVVLFYDLTDGADHTLARGKLTIIPEVRQAG